MAIFDSVVWVVSWGAHGEMVRGLKLFSKVLLMFDNQHCNRSTGIVRTILSIALPLLRKIALATLILLDGGAHVRQVY